MKYRGTVIMTIATQAEGVGPPHLPAAVIFEEQMFGVKIRYQPFFLKL